MRSSLSPQSLSFSQATGFLSDELEGILNALLSAEDDRWKLRDLVEELVSRKNVLERRCQDIVDRADRAERNLETELMILRAECTALQSALEKKERQLSEVNSLSHSNSNHHVNSIGMLHPYSLYSNGSPRGEASPSSSSVSSSFMLLQQQQIDDMNQRLVAQEKTLSLANLKIEENNAAVGQLLEQLSESNRRLMMANETIARQRAILEALGYADVPNNNNNSGSNISSNRSPSPSPMLKPSSSPLLSSSMLLSSSSSNDRSGGSSTNAVTATNDNNNNNNDSSSTASLRSNNSIVVNPTVPSSSSSSASSRASPTLTSTGMATAMMTTMDLMPRSSLGKTLDTFVENDDIDAVIAMMRGNPEAEFKQEQGCLALSQLADKPENAANRAAIGKKGGIEAIISAMRLHQDSVSLSRAGTQALQKIAVAAANRKRMGSSGAVTVIVSAMLKHSSDAKVQEYGCSALSILAQNNAANRALITKGRGIEAVAAAMRHHNSDSVVQMVACAALVKLALTPEETGRLGESLQRKTFDDGAYIIKQGDEGKHFFIIADGEAVVTKAAYPNGPEKELLKLGKGQYFGEVALLRDEPRTANVVARGSVKCLCMTREDFRKLLSYGEDGSDHAAAAPTPKKSVRFNSE